MIEIRHFHEIRKSNLLNLIMYLHKNGDCYRKDLGMELGLSVSSVTNLCNILENARLLVKTNETKANEIKGPSYFGRTARLVRLSQNEFYIGILDLSLKETACFRLVELDGQTIAIFELKLLIRDSFEQFVDAFYSRFKAEVSRHELNGKLLVISVILAGAFNHETGKTFATNVLKFQGVQMKSILEEKFKVTVSIENDSNTTALGIALTREENGVVLYLHLDEGIGLGVIMNNFIFSGEHGFAPEICCIPLGALHQTIHQCGNYDCAEGHLCLMELSKLTEKSGLEQREFTEHKGLLLGRMIAILFDLFDPEKLYIGGQSAPFLEALWPYAEHELSKRSLSHNQRETIILWDFDFHQVQYEGAFYIAMSAALQNCQRI